jgi:pimeloyl-ACP methyl ester carboxylesterase
VTTAITILSIVAITVLLFGFAVRYGFRAPRIKETGDPADYGLNFRAVNIPGKNGANLFGWHILASDKPAASTILIMHGWGVNAEVILPVAVPLCRAGYNALLVDARNHGSSDSGGP